MKYLTSSYVDLLENLEDKVDTALDTLTMSVLRDKKSEKYERIKRRRGAKEFNSDIENEDERALFTKTFKGRCHKCGNFRHETVECRSKVKRGSQSQSQSRDGRLNNSERFQGNCNHCRKYDHKGFQCWTEHGRPIKTEEQVSQAVEEVEDQDEEVVLMAWSSRIEEDEGTKYSQDIEENQEEVQEQEPPRSRQAERRQRGGRGVSTRLAPARARRLLWNKRNHEGWGARPGDQPDWTTRSMS